MSQSQYSSTNPLQQNSGNNAPKIESFPVHTMAQDLAASKNPGAGKADSIAAFAAFSPVSRPIESLPKNQQSSPFLGQTAPGLGKDFATDSSAGHNPEKISVRTSAPSAKISMAGEKINYNKAIGLIGVFVIILISLGGFYYYWTTRGNDSASESTEVGELIVVPEFSSQPETFAPAAEFSTDRPNYLQIDQQTGADAIKAALAQYGAKIAGLRPPVPVEFIVTDQDNSPLNIDVFLQQAGVVLSPETIGQLNGAFSLFIDDNAESNDYRIGLMIDIKSDQLIKNALTNEEVSLIEKLQPLIAPDVSQPPTDPAFRSSIYKGAYVRFRNISATGDLSVDYAVSSDKLFIGNNKDILRSIVDYADSISTSTSN